MKSNIFEVFKFFYLKISLKINNFESNKKKDNIIEKKMELEEKNENEKKKNISNKINKKEKKKK